MYSKLMDKIVSFDIKADFGFLKKPDTNDPIYLTFNMLHKPALLGILGAILGLQGFSEAKKDKKKGGKKTEKQTVSQEELLPEYYKQLKNLKVGIKPLNDENGNFEKTIIKYNNGVGYANLDGGNLIVVEQTLIKPNYRCYILLDDNSQLYDYLKHFKAEYLPYLGKNDFSLWWDNFTEYQFSLFHSEDSFQLSSIFIKEENLKEGKKKQAAFNPSRDFSASKFMYFENLPVGYNTDLMQYEYESFAYTNWDLKQNYNVDNLYKLSSNEIIQLF